MAYQHRLQASRFEFKYVIDESVALHVRKFLAGYLEPDEHARRSADNSYLVHSLYLDSPDLFLFRQTARGLKNRFKLRIRFYDGDPESPAFLEVKRRETDVIRKERAAVRRTGVERLLEGGWPDATYLVRDDGPEKARRALQSFCELYDSIDGQPCLYVCYEREAYVSPESDLVRVTFDRQLNGCEFDRRTPLVPPPIGTMPNVGGVILEVKFTDRFPPWMQEMAESFNLQRRSVPKYNLCVKAMGLEPWKRYG